jgi:hypothetical protein
VRVSYPQRGRQRSGLTVRVPKRLAVRIEGGGGSEAGILSAMRSVHLEGVVGDVGIRDLEGAVTGTHRNGRLTITDVGSVSITLVSSRATIGDVRGAVTLNTRNGECKVVAARGPIEIDEVNNAVTVSGSVASVRVSGNNGSVTIERPRGEVNVDVRRAEVEVTLATSARLTLLTTDEPLRLLLEGPPSIDVDAIATEGGKIDARDLGVEPTKADLEARMSHAFGAAGGARVALRNLRGDIVIRKAK